MIDILDVVERLVLRTKDSARPSMPECPYPFPYRQRMPPHWHWTHSRPSASANQTALGVSGEEGTFNICTFWLVEAMTRAGQFDRRRLEEARLMFEKMLGYASHLGLYAEETGSSGESLGNFPQAFTHLALISAAFNLDRALGGGGG